MYEYVLFLHMHIKSAMRNAAEKLLLWLNMLNKSDMRIVNFWFLPKQPSIFVVLMIYNTKVYLLLKKKRQSLDKLVHRSKLPPWYGTTLEHSGNVLQCVLYMFERLYIKMQARGTCSSDKFDNSLMQQTHSATTLNATFWHSSTT